MKRIYLISFVFLCAFFGVQVLEAQDSFTARVYYVDGGSDIVYDFMLLEDVPGMLVSQGETEYNFNFSVMRRIEAIASEPVTWPDGETGYIDTLRITFKNGEVGTYDAYESEEHPSFFTGYTESGEWWEYEDLIAEIEFL